MTRRRYLSTWLQRRVAGEGPLSAVCLVGQARKDGRTIFSMSRLRSAGSAAQPRDSSRRAKAVNFLTEPSCLSRKRRSIQCQHIVFNLRAPKKAPPGQPKLVFSAHTLCS